MVEDSTPKPPGGAPADEPRQPKPNNPEFITRRVLLHETLIEEYETHTPFDKSDEGSSGESGETSSNAATRELRAPDLKDVRQPALKQKDVDALSQRGDPIAENEDEESEEKRVGNRASDFFTLIVKAQSKEAQRLDAMRGEYLTKIQLFSDKPGVLKGWDNRPSDKKLADALIAAEVYGILDDLREKHWAETAHTNGEKSRREELLELIVVESWLAGYRAARAAKRKEADEKRAAQEARDKAANAVSLASDVKELHPDSVADARQSPVEIEVRDARGAERTTHRISEFKVEDDDDIEGNTATGNQTTEESE